jgi:Protein of unknown function (DUF2281)
MQNNSIENNLNLSVLPINAQQELIDFYEFLVNKYAYKQNTTLRNTPSLKGVFMQYADPSKIALEKTAWQKHLLDNYSDD